MPDAYTHSAPQADGTFLGLYMLEGDAAYRVVLDPKGQAIAFDTHTRAAASAGAFLSAIKGEMTLLSKPWGWRGESWGGAGEIRSRRVIPQGPMKRGFVGPLNKGGKAQPDQHGGFTGHAADAAGYARYAWEASGELTEEDMVRMRAQADQIRRNMETRTAEEIRRAYEQGYAPDNLFMGNVRKPRKGKDPE